MSQQDLDNRELSEREERKDDSLARDPDEATSVVSLPSRVNYFPAENMLVMDYVQEQLQALEDAKTLLALADSPAEHDAAKASMASREREKVERLEKEAKKDETVTVGLSEIDQDGIEAGQARLKERNERGLTEKFVDKLSGWSFVDHTDRIKIEDLYKAGKGVAEVAKDKIVEPLAEVADDLTGNVATNLKATLLEIMHAEPDPKAREKYALIMKANAKYHLANIVQAFQRAGPFGFKAALLPLELQKLATAATILQFVRPKEWAEIAPDYELLQEVTKKKSREDFRELGYETPVSMEAFTDEYLAAELGILETPFTVRPLAQGQDGEILETAGATRFDLVMTHYQAMKQLIIGRRRFELEVADAKTTQDVSVAYDRFWENVESFKNALPGYVRESVVRGLIFGADGKSRLSSPSSVAAFQLLAEKASREGSTGVSSDSLRRVSQDLGSALTSAHRERLGEEEATAFAGLWSEQPTEQLFSKSVTDMSKEEIESFLSELKEGDPGSYLRARSLYEHLRTQLRPYNNLHSSVEAIDYPSSSEQLSESLLGSVQRQQTADAEGKPIEEIIASPKFDTFLQNHDAALDRIESSLGRDLRADPQRILEFFEQYANANQYDSDLSAQARANIMLFRRAYQSIVPSIRLPQAPESSPPSSL